MEWFLIVMLVVFIVVVRILYENHHIQKTIYEIKSNKLKDDVKIIFLSDLHNQSFGKNNKKLIEQIEQERPDYVLVGGDMLVGKRGELDHNAKNAWELLQGIVNIFPVFYVNGNHETRMKYDIKKYGIQYQEYEKKIKQLGIRILNDDNILVEEKGIQISGIELGEQYYKKRGAKWLEVSDIEDKLGRTDRKFFQILLAHKPEYFSVYTQWGADLILSGHNHGGIVRLPFFGGIISTQYRILPKYDGGLYTKENKRMIVSRGLGGHTIKVRFLNLPDLVIIHLHKIE